MIHIIPKNQMRYSIHQLEWEDRLTNISLKGDHGWDLSRLPLCASEIKLTFYQILLFFVALITFLTMIIIIAITTIITRAWLRRVSSLSSSLWTSQAKSKGSCLCFQVWWDIGCDIVNMMLMNVIGAFLGWWPQLLRMFLLQMQRWLNNGGEQHCSLRWPQLELLGADLSK